MKSMKMALITAMLATSASPSIIVHGNSCDKREAWQSRGKKPKPKQR